MNMEKRFDSLVASITLEDNLLFIFKLKNTSAEYDEEEVIKQFDFFYGHAQGKPYKVLLDARNSLVLPTDESFTYFFKFNRPESKTAIIANSLPTSLLMSQMLKLGRVENVKVFKSEERAREWLLSSD